MQKLRILFVCLGNICRSPMAEGLFTHKVSEAGLTDFFEIDSCGTGAWHAGERADVRMRETADSHGIALTSIARQVQTTDFSRFDYILPMDDSNLINLQRFVSRMNNAKATLVKMRFFDSEQPNADVPDPYYGGADGFEEVYRILDRSTQAFLEFLVEKHELVPQQS
ncbi:MAG: low molecular weight protein-tyrosine-phosphatase [Bacteroidota bacterium]